MGGIAQSIFGGSRSKQKSESGNKAFGQISSALAPMMGYSGEGASGISRLLGGDASGFNSYKKATGFDSLLEQGSRGITGNAAASGLLRSGGTGKALVDYGNKMQNQYAGDYLRNLLGLGGLGLQAASTISGAGQYGTSSGKSSDKPGIGGFIGSMLPGGGGK